MKPKFWALLAVSLSVGLILAWVDSRPNWDDTGITATMLFGASACLGFSMPRFAWLWAILLGIWIPMVNIILHQNFGSSIALVITFTGAFAGVFVHKIFKSVAA
jgi:hypothetical protein